MKRDDLEKYLNEYLKVADFKDYCPNGLQVSGKSEIQKVIIGVSACIDLFDKAVENNADAIIVHHGLIWDGMPRIYKGSYRERVKILLENNLNLFGFHLPLDAHSEVGNNIVLANVLGLKKIEPFADYHGNKIGFKGETGGVAAEEIFNRVRERIKSDPLIFDFGPEIVSTVGIVSGGAQSEINQAVAEDLDLYLTGEVSEYNMHTAKEEQIHFIAAGHHATERFGIQALGEHLSKKFQVEVDFINVPNPA